MVYICDGLYWGRLFSFIWSNYWFINCIIIYYALFYFVVDLITKHKYCIGWYLCGTSLTIAVITAFFVPKAEGSLFHTNWHYICHFSVMILGGITFKYFKGRKSIQNKKKDWIWLLFSFAAYFAIMKTGKGHTDWSYYLQLLCLIPLHLFCYYCFKVFSGNWCERLFVTNGLRWPFIVLSSLTLEIYIVQFVIITDRYNSLFPLSLVIVFTLITFVAYILRVASNLFVQFVSKEPWQWKNALKITC
ncbi:MAG: acyltransferase [Prevotella ruminicola]|uniref:Acyltransferase n=1 Tax=Xylanibacter ruminicola TaxID=839 RepID=A0A9D5P228_XYLRU|nr:acyltransferase [Xylanibacter ruminicola]